ncbi:GAP family protein [Nonomuraea recticatena]|uniref:GAP family protein n=1 Tax=Nonomuraea recticatena TaxID=46178 RepID=A0ABN3TBK6_9ACTN
MGEVLSDLLPFALTVAISPVPIIAVILMLLAPKAGGAGIGFLVGWVAGIVVATGVLIVLANAIGLASARGQPSAGASWIKLLLGLALLAMALKQWKSRPKPGQSAELPGWMRAVDKVTPAKAATLGLLLSAVNPKNLMMCVAAGVAIAAGDLSGAQETVLLVLFTILAACSVAVPVIVYATNATRVRAPLDRLKGWLQQNNATVMFVLLLVMGVVLAGKGVGGLM